MVDPHQSTYKHDLGEDALNMYMPDIHRKHPVPNAALVKMTA